MTSLCPICNHVSQGQIETALLAGRSIETVAEEFKLDITKLKVHIAMHLGSFAKDDSGLPEETLSIAQKLKIQEAVTLRNVYQEYYATLKKLGNHISQKITQADKDDTNVDRFLANSTINLYLGAGSKIIETIRALADIDQIMNGKDSSSNDAIIDLIKAIRNTDTVPQYVNTVVPE